MKTYLLFFGLLIAFVSKTSGQACPGALGITGIGPIVAQCGSVNNIVFTVDVAVPNQEVSYPHGPTEADCFILPPGWTYVTVGGGTIVGSGFSRAERYRITVKPSASTGGTIQVRNKAFCGTATPLYSSYETANVVRPGANVGLSGPNNFCIGSTGTFTLNGVSPGSSITWYVDPAPEQNMQIIGGRNANSVTVQGISNGTGKISAVIYDQCGNRSAPEQLVYVGVPTVKNFTVNTSMCLGYSQVVVANTAGNPTSWNWYVSSGNASNAYLTDYGGGTAYFNSYNADCYGLTVQMSNACGTSSDGVTICAMECFSPYKVYPNPAKDYVTVEFEKADKSEVLPDEVELYSEPLTDPVLVINVQEEYKNNKMAQGRNLVLNVKGMPRGTYYLHIKNSRNKANPIDKIRILLE